MLRIAYTGGGKRDVNLTTEKREHAMFVSTIFQDFSNVPSADLCKWWFIMEIMFCLAAIPVKWAICFTLLRIADGRKIYVWSIYTVMAAVAIVIASTTIYEFFHCTPVRMN